MQRTSFADISCSVARALDIVGEWWTPLILRDIFLGVKRFEQIQLDLGIPRKVLAARLATLVEHDVLRRVPYRDGRIRHEYELTERGRDFVTTLVALMNWGDRWLVKEDGVPVRAIHTGCGGELVSTLICQKCGEATDSLHAHGEAGPGARTGKGTAFVGRFARPSADLERPEAATKLPQ
jgi:DNA-binding HxlR family transcriptional regulator